MLRGFLIFSTFILSAMNVEITIDTRQVTMKTSSRFLSVAIDSGVVRRHWEKFQPRSSKVQTLAAALSPCYLRVGGTDADFLIFSRDNNTTAHQNYSTTSNNNPETLELNLNINPKVNLKSARENYASKLLSLENRDGLVVGYDMPKTLNTNEVKLKDGENVGATRAVREDVDNTSGLRYKRDVGLPVNNHDLTNFTMTAAFYDQIHAFVSSVGWNLIFDLNVLLRQNGHWDPSNALDLMNYTATKGYKMAGWELGNEPDEFRNMFINFTIPPDALAEDYLLLQAIKDCFPDHVAVKIIGPSIAAMTASYRVQFFRSFMNSGGGDVVNAASFHQYYVNGREATIDQFYDPAVLNVLLDEIALGVGITKASGSTAKVWLGETSSAWGGGAPGLSNTYVAGFMWLDKLGIGARDGIDVMIRQSFYGGHYALLDPDTLDPRPDYWLSLLYKTLVGPQVLNVTSPNSKGKLRVYAHCTDSNRSGYKSGSVAIFILNLDTADVTVTFPGLSAITKLHVYSMTPGDNSLTSGSVLLNGQLLELKDGKIPNLRIPVTVSQNVTVPALTYSFVVVPDENVTACK